MKTLVKCDVENYGAQHLHTSTLWLINSLTTASDYSLPPNLCSLVPNWWLTFIGAGLSSLIDLALLGTLI